MESATEEEKAKFREQVRERFGDRRDQKPVQPRPAPSHRLPGRRLRPRIRTPSKAAQEPARNRMPPVRVDRSIISQHAIRSEVRTWNGQRYSCGSLVLVAAGVIIWRVGFHSPTLDLPGVEQKAGAQTGRRVSGPNEPNGTQAAAQAEPNAAAVRQVVGRCEQAGRRRSESAGQAKQPDAKPGTAEGAGGPPSRERRSLRSRSRRGRRSPRIPTIRWRP